MQLTPSASRGLEYLTRVTALCQRIRSEHPTQGVWEAADFQWWWRRPRISDTRRQLFWSDPSGETVAAAIVTDWGGRHAIDVLVSPNQRETALPHIWEQAVASTADLQTPLEVMIDDADLLLHDLSTAAGFVDSGARGASAWLEAEDRPSIAPLPIGYELISRGTSIDEAHHFAASNGPNVAERLAETSLYRSDLDLFIRAPDGGVAAYGLFWFDPTTATGFVEPMGTSEGHRRQGLARHVLTAGVGALADLGASRIKINYDAGNEASSTLYRSVGFVPVMTTSLLVRPPSP